MHLVYIFHAYCFTVWFQSDFGIWWNFINDTLTRWIMLNVYFVFSNFSKRTCFPIVSTQLQYRNIKQFTQIIFHDSSKIYWHVNVKVNGYNARFFTWVSAKFYRKISYVQNADYLGCKTTFQGFNWSECCGSKENK